MATPQQIAYWLQTLFQLNETTIRQLQQFAAFIQEWNQKINLVSRKDVDFLWEHHILPSLLVLKVTHFDAGERILDIGSGGGFPALPLKIVRPDVQLILVESIRKKAHVLENAIAHLQLDQITVVNERVENLHPQAIFAHQFHTITARAVADVATLYRWGKPLLQSGGRLLLWKGERDIADLHQAQKQLGFTATVLQLPDDIAREHPRWASTRWFEIRI